MFYSFFHTILFGGIVIKRYVENYINKLTKEEAKVFLDKENIHLSKDEEDACFLYVKKNWHLLFENQEKIFSDLKNILNPTSYNHIKPILLSYLKKYSSYL